MINGDKINKNPKKPKVLIVPLNWGLGHATRCIPIINELIFQNCEVIIAADGGVFSLLKKEFPTLVFIRIKGYNIKYSRNKSWLPFILLLQFPKIMFSIWKENLWLKKIIDNYNIDAIISDNRFGMYYKKLPSIYITHQLLIKTGKNFTEKILQKFHYFFIKKYTCCWVPDSKENGLAGELSHPVNIPPNILYIGPLSRFEKKNDISKVYDILISISGPEPQRSFFEKKIFSQIKNSDKKILFVRGLPEGNNQAVSKQKNSEIIDHLPSKELNIAFHQSEVI
ncbi:MAG: glycosyltransferase, partial [Ginsengibacter sp.]